MSPALPARRHAGWGRDPSRWRVAAAVLVFGALGTMVAWGILRARDEDLARDALDNAVQERASGVQGQVEHSLTEVRATASFLQADQAPGPAFEAFTTALIAGDPLVETIAWVVRVPPEQREAHLAAARARGLEGYLITPGAASATAPEGDAYPTWYVAVTGGGTEMSLGTDWASFPMAMDAVRRAVDTGDVGATGPLAPLARSGEPAPVALVAPIYAADEPTDTPEQRRLALSGFVVMLERVDRMLVQATERLARHGVDLAATDVTRPAEPVLLALRPSALRRRPFDPARMAPGAGGLRDASELFVAGRTWRIEGVATDAFAGRPAATAELAVLIGGWATTLLATALAWTMGGRLERTATERIRSVAETAIDAIVTADALDRITYVNAAAERLFGRPERELVGQPVTVLMPETYRATHLEAMRQHLATGRSRFVGDGLVELEGLRADGTPFPIEVSLGSWIEPDGRPAFAAVIRDISARRRLEEERLAVTEDLRRAREAADEATHAKSSFLANMSHELRTPLNSIVGLVELLQGTELDRRQRSDLDQIARSADSLLRLLGDILDFSRIEARRLELVEEEFQLRDALGGTLQPLTLRAREKGLELAYRVAPDVPDRLVGDAGRLQQVVINLVGNAIKFTERGEVVVEVEREEDLDERVRLAFSVRDTGPGIPAEQQQRLFEAFVQGSDEARRAGGVGLGLAIASGLVELMGGTITVESASGCGSTFRFTVVLERAEGAAAAEQGAPAELAGTRVLVVDDNATNRRILAEMLRSWGLVPEAVSDGTAALPALHAAADAGTPFRAALLDGRMPGMDGVELARRIHADPRLSTTPLLLLSSTPLTTADDAVLREVGLVASLDKPVSHSELLVALEQALGLAVEPPPSTPASPPTGLRLKVLLAEDNPVNQAVARRMLEQLGHEVRVVSDGQEAVDATAREAFDVVLMDVQMPVLDGERATAAIRAREADTGVHVPIVAMTAYAMRGDRERLLAAGMDGYLAKPVRIAALRDVVAEMAEGRGSEATVPAEGTVVDRALALEQAGGSRATLLSLMELYAGAERSAKERIASAVGEGDAAALEQAAHALLGAVLPFGAPGAVRAARHLEELARSGGMAGAPDAEAALEAELDELDGALDAWRRELGAA